MPRTAVLYKWCMQGQTARMPCFDPGLTISEAAEKYPHIPRRSISAAAERGQIPARRVGRMFLLDAEGVRLYARIFDARRELDKYVTTAQAS